MDSSCGNGSPVNRVYVDPNCGEGGRGRGLVSTTTWTFDAFTADAENARVIMGIVWIRGIYII